jgi:hypothetical protein
LFTARRVQLATLAARHMVPMTVISRTAERGDEQLAVLSQTEYQRNRNK